MTELEAEVWAVRLTRIWGGVAPFVVEVTDVVAHFTAPLTPDVELQVGASSGATFYWLFEVGSDSSFLYCDDSGRANTLTPNSWGNAPDECLCPRQTEWLPFFRRNCWLSGCPIKATAHEKTEWMQGFTREEVDAWNLKM